jgi:uncharacterized protein YprB with RNaseH-like and TPR domain
MVPSEVVNVLFIDIETVSSTGSYQELDTQLQKLWSRKANYLRKSAEDSDEKLYQTKAGIYAEFGKIIVIGLGRFSIDPDLGLKFRQKSFAGHNEQILLKNFRDFVESDEIANLKLCAHNGKEFDYPYLCRRMIVNGFRLPSILDLSGKKPWAVTHLDTMDLWKFGDYKHLTSLELLAKILGLTGSKNDLDGSKVNSVYRQPGGLDRIIEYCSSDVLTLAEIFLKMKGYQHEKISICPWD